MSFLSGTTKPRNFFAMILKDITYHLYGKSQFEQTTELENMLSMKEIWKSRAGPFIVQSNFLMLSTFVRNTLRKLASLLIVKPKIYCWNWHKFSVFCNSLRWFKIGFMQRKKKLLFISICLISAIYNESENKLVFSQTFIWIGNITFLKGN